MFKYLFRYLKLRSENERLSQELDEQRKLTTTLFAEISRRDQKIAEQQKRMRFFGIRIGNEEDEAEKLDFSFYDKNLKKGALLVTRLRPKGNANAF